MSIYTGTLEKVIRNPDLRYGLEEAFALIPAAQANAVVSVAFDGNDMVFTLADDTEVTLAGAKIALTGAAGAPGTPGESISIVAGTPKNAKAAKVVMTIDGVAVHGEKVTIGDDVFQFTAGTAADVDEGAIPVEIGNKTTKSSVTLTLVENPKLGDKMTIGTKTYTFVPSGTANADWEIEVSGTLEDTEANIASTIMGGGSSQAHPDVTCGAFESHVLTITAKIGGVVGDSIVSTDEFTNAGNVFSGVSLGSGADCSKADARTALVAAINDHGTEATAEAGAGDTLTISAKIRGVSKNSVVIAETMAHGAFAEAAETLAGGVDGTVGVAGAMLADNSYIYRAIAENTIADANWRRVSLGAEY